MPLFGLFAETRPSFEGLGSFFQFDASISELHSVRAEWTSEPIEGGSEITDNRVLPPRRFQITAVVSSSMALLPDRERHIKAWSRLRELVTATPAQLYTISTVLENYRDMALLEASVPVNATTGDAITATILAEEKQIARTGVAVNLAVAAQDGGLAEVDLGTQGFEAAA